MKRGRRDRLRPRPPQEARCRDLARRARTGVPPPRRPAGRARELPLRVSDRRVRDIERPRRALPGARHHRVAAAGDGGGRVILRPFFRFYGAKWRSVCRGLYPRPIHDTIIEPFAGSAGYSLHYPERAVILVERDATLASIWRYLIGATAEDVMRIPLVDD